MLIENIFTHLFKSSNYFRTVYPHLSDRYFSDKSHKIVIKKIKEYNESYNKVPQINDIKLLIEGDTNIIEGDSQNCYSFLDSLKNVEIASNEEFLIKETEKYCKNRALENAIIDSVDIIQKNENFGVIEEKVKEALAVEFQVKIGHDYFADAPARFEEYTKEDICVPIDIEVINTALGGGFRKKSIYIFLGRCVCANTLITVRNKHTKEIETITIENFYKRFK